jgi:hypothetical protein
VPEVFHFLGIFLSIGLDFRLVDEMSEVQLGAIFKLNFSRFGLYSQQRNYGLGNSCSRKIEIKRKTGLS